MGILQHPGQNHHHHIVVKIILEVGTTAETSMDLIVPPKFPTQRRSGSKKKGGLKRK